MRSIMERNIAAKIIFLVIVLMHSHPGVSLSETDGSIPGMQTIKEFSYHAGPGDTRKTARALTLFGAQHKAVLWSAERLIGGGLLQGYGDKQREIWRMMAMYTFSSGFKTTFDPNGVYASTSGIPPGRPP